MWDSWAQRGRLPQRANVMARKTAPHSADPIRMTRGARLSGLRRAACMAHGSGPHGVLAGGAHKEPSRAVTVRAKRRPGGELPQGGVRFHPQARRLARSLCQTLLPRQFVGDAPGEHQRPAHVQPREAGRVDVGVGAAAVVAVGEQAADGVALLIPRPRGSRWPTGRSVS